MLGKVFNGNSFEVLSDLADQCEYPVIVTDPPFNIGYHYRTYSDKMDSEEYYETLAKLIGDYPCVVIHYPEQLHRLSIEFGYEPTRVVSWVYNANTARQHRDIAFYGIKPDFELVRRPYKDYKDKRVAELAKRTGGARSYDWISCPQVKNKSPDKTIHPCQMPLEVMEDVVSWISWREDMTVIDPFSGSGTTAVACERLGIPWIAIELDPAYCSVIGDRVAVAGRKEKKYFYTDPNDDNDGSETDDHVQKSLFDI